jgi:hypothetical protein
MLLREKREQLKQIRLGNFKKCDMVNSKDVNQMWIQDRSKPMVIIGSDAVSLYPSMTKTESADEVAEAVLESDLVWEGVDWKEAVRFIVLGRDETWCRSQSPPTEKVQEGHQAWVLWHRPTWSRGRR